MGNTDSANLQNARDRSEQRILLEVSGAIERDSVEDIKQITRFDFDSSWINAEINENGDTALIYATRCKSLEVLQFLIEMRCDIYAKNWLQESALSIAVSQYLQSVKGWSDSSTSSSRDLDILTDLIQAGAIGSPLIKLLLNCMDDHNVINLLSMATPNVHMPQNYKYTALLLQAAVWFDYREVVKLLLHRGIDVQVFWDAPFMPTVTPNASPNYKGRIERDEEGAEYLLGAGPAEDQDEALQQTKLALVQDWRHEWDDGATPEAAARAALQLPHQYFNLFLRVSHRLETLNHMLHEIERFPPVSSSGPRIGTETFSLLIAQGYIFSEWVISFLSNKYGLQRETFSPPKSCQSLKSLCRTTIRSCGGTNLLVFVNVLPLPDSLKAYLLLGDIDSNNEVSWLLASPL